MTAPMMLLAKKRQRAAAVAKLVQRFETAQPSAQRALTTDADALIAEGTVPKLIDLYNSMAGSAPDLPRASYSRSKRAASTVVSTLRVAKDDDNVNDGDNDDCVNTVECAEAHVTADIDEIAPIATEFDDAAPADVVTIEQLTANDVNALNSDMVNTDMVDADVTDVDTESECSSDDKSECGDVEIERDNGAVSPVDVVTPDVIAAPIDGVEASVDSSDDDTSDDVDMNDCDAPLDTSNELALDVVTVEQLTTSEIDAPDIDAEIKCGCDSPPIHAAMPVDVAVDACIDTSNDSIDAMDVDSCDACQHASNDADSDDGDTSNDTGNDTDDSAMDDTDDDECDVHSNAATTAAEQVSTCPADDDDVDNQSCDDDDELSTCDETASIHSLAMSFASDCSFEDDASDASSYYEREFRVHHQAPLALPPVPSKSEDDTPEQPDVSKSTDITKTAPVKASMTEATPATAPLARLPSPIPIHAKPSVRGTANNSRASTAAPVQAVKQLTVTPTAPTTRLKPKPVPPPITSARVAQRKVAPSPITTTPTRSASRTAPAPLSITPMSSGVTPVRRRKRCEPTTPRKPVERPICPRHAAAAAAAAHAHTAHTTSPCKHTAAKRPLRRNSMSEPKVLAPSRTASASRLSGVPPAHSPKRPLASASARSVATSPAQPPRSAPSLSSHARDVASSARVRTRSHDISAWSSRSSSSLVAALEASVTQAPATPSRTTNESRPSRIRSRLFDFENDPKRLELIAANRARRRSVDFGSS